MVASMTTEVADKAQAITTSLTQATNAIRLNSNLTPDGRMRVIAKASVKAADEMAALHEQFDDTSERAATNLNRDLFGAVSTAGVDAISARDADDRAAQLETPEQALALLERADANGDEILARAIALRAYREGTQMSGLFGASWAPVLDAFSATRPGVAGKIAEFADAQRTSVERKLRNAAWFYVSKPSEIGGLSDYQVRALSESR